jgi:ABC-type branched-subunit amino acid transport system ATPase component
MPTHPALLETTGLVKHFGGLRAVQDLDLTVREREIVGLIGPNGSGKTTVFNLITGIYRPTAGRITFDHGRHDLAPLPSHAVTALGIARTFQNQRLFNQMTVLENVLVGLHCRTRAGIAGILLGAPGVRRERARSEKRARELLALFGDRLLPRASEPAWTLSYANRRRLEIARALATQPRLLLLDEPAAGMNPTETRELMRDIEGVRDRGVTILLIEHDMGVVRGVCDRVIALDYGTKIAEGRFEEVRDHPGVLEAYLGRRGGRA